MAFDFQLETRLRRQSPELHRIFTDNVLCCQNMLNQYQSMFPNYTDHTALHSLEVIAFCNELVGDQIEMLNADEIFVLLMAAYLHDSGMGISQKDYLRFTPRIPAAKAFMEQHPEEEQAELIRRFHHEYSGQYIRQYAPVFDFPSEKHLFSVIQVSRGHRKTDLWDEQEYPRALQLENGNVLHLPYLAALIRLADELDIAADRNLQFMYDVSHITNELSIMAFRCHTAIRHLSFGEDCLIAHVQYEDEALKAALDELFEKLNETLSSCVRTVEELTPFRIRQRYVKIVPVE